MVDNTCDKCFDGLVIRMDDQPETVRARLAVYHAQTEPLKGYYDAQGKLVVVEGQFEVAHTTRDVFKAIEA